MLIHEERENKKHQDSIWSDNFYHRCNQFLDKQGLIVVDTNDLLQEQHDLGRSTSDNTLDAASEVLKLRSSKSDSTTKSSTTIFDSSILKRRGSVSKIHHNKVNHNKPAHKPMHQGYHTFHHIPNRTDLNSIEELSDNLSKLSQGDLGSLNDFSPSCILFSQVKQERDSLSVILDQNS